MSLLQQLDEHIGAAYAGIWIKTYEPDAARDIVTSLARHRQWSVLTWDFSNFLGGDEDTLRIVSGLKITGAAIDFSKPSRVIKALPAIHRALQTDRTLLLLRNCHRNDFIRDNAGLVQAIQDAVLIGKAQGFAIIMESPIVNLPPELERLFTVLEHPLPTKQDLWQVATKIDETVKPPEDPAERTRLLQAAAGLTITEAENVFALSVVRGRPFDPATVWEQKAQVLAKNGLLELYNGSASMDQLGGMSHVRTYTERLLRPVEDPDLYAKGLLLLGVPGGGKSEFIKALGNHLGRRVLIMHVGQLRSKWQGETDQNMKQALATADAMAPCILMIDEVEKALAGVASSGQTDGGSGARVFGTMLEWMNDHTSDVFLACTCNNLQILLENNPEFARAERFDGMFFFDLPDKAARRQIWEIYLKRYYKDTWESLLAEMWPRLNSMSYNWTGAEIKAAARLSRMLDHPIHKMDELVVPVTETSQAIEYVRNWANGLCLAADKPGRYYLPRTDAPDGKPPAARRKLSSSVSAEPSEKPTPRKVKIRPPK